MFPVLASLRKEKSHDHPNRKLPNHSSELIGFNTSSWDRYVNGKGVMDRDFFILGFQN